MSSQSMRKAVVISRVGVRLALRPPFRCCSSLFGTCRTIPRNRLKDSESLLKGFLRLAASKDFLFPKLHAFDVELRFRIAVFHLNAYL